ncbi:non-heme iron oxygenase ferredoxin subunit [Gammaproteobacteria bacterium]|nr:non-heme iron oxygenase ferredoxin subunit [Gammaproteobacteria bacterium]
MSNDWQDVAAEGEIAHEGHRVVEVEGTYVAVFNINGDYLAVEDTCTHDGGEIACGDVDGETIICPRHGARFCLRTGKVLEAPAYADIHSFPIRIEQGRVQVRDNRWD